MLHESLLSNPVWGYLMIRSSVYPVVMQMGGDVVKRYGIADALLSIPYGSVAGQTLTVSGM